MRYFAELAYNGASFQGWQSQPGRNSVQQAIESPFSLILRQPIEVMGCGRTDTGVHARQFFLHFDFDGEIPSSFLHRVNKLLPSSIAIFRVFPVAPDAHARFDAIQRSYTYYMTYRKDPFRQDTVYLYRQAQRPDPELMQAAAQLLLEYRDFNTFCLSDNDAKTKRCDLRRADWIVRSPDELEFHITSDRFLRSMVRLIVGMCINVGLGRIRLQEVREAMDRQVYLKKAETVPAEGLFLTEVAYDFEAGLRAQGPGLF